MRLWHIVVGAFFVAVILICVIYAGIAVAIAAAVANANYAYQFTWIGIVEKSMWENPIGVSYSLNIDWGEVASELFMQMIHTPAGIVVGFAVVFGIGSYIASLILKTVLRRLDNDLKGFDIPRGN